MKGCTNGFSDNKFKKHQTSLDDKTKIMIDQMINIESRDQDFLHTIICQDNHPNDSSHHACLRKEGHKGKHYCIDCGESWK